MLTAYCIIIDGAMDGPLLCKGDCSATAIHADDGRQTTGVTVAKQRVWRPPNDEQIKRKGVAVRQYPSTFRAEYD